MITCSAATRYSVEGADNGDARDGARRLVVRDSAPRHGARDQKSGSRRRVVRESATVVGAAREMACGIGWEEMARGAR
eukprot:1060599-Pleurochrysis_carterae.AAC.1